MVPSPHKKLEPGHLRRLFFMANTDLGCRSYGGLFCGFINQHIVLVRLCLFECLRKTQSTGFLFSLLYEQPSLFIYPIIQLFTVKTPFKAILLYIISFTFTVYLDVIHINRSKAVYI